MMPRLSVTSVKCERPVSFSTLFSLRLPFRYSTTSTDMPISLHSWKPACGPSVWPVPRSTRKLNCAYGRSRCVAISGSLGRLARTGLLWGRLPVAEPDEIVVGELELFHG